MGALDFKNNKVPLFARKTGNINTLMSRFYAMDGKYFYPPLDSIWVDLIRPKPWRHSIIIQWWASIPETIHTDPDLV